MRTFSRRAGILLTVLVLGVAMRTSAHVTLQTSQTLRPKGTATVIMNVPNERFVDTTKITLQVPEAFLAAGGRLSRMVFPPGWTVTFEKKDKPGDVLKRENDQRAKKQATTGASGEHESPAANSEDAKEKQALDDMRRKWITSVTYSGGTIPPDGFQQFQISFQLPEHPGTYRFPAEQTYADGTVISWSELVEGAQHPAASLVIQEAPLIDYSKLPLPLSGLALLVSVIALIRQARKAQSAELRESVVPGRKELANV